MGSSPTAGVNKGEFMGDVILPKLELASSTLGTADVYSFRFKRGWAIFTVNDATGEFFITSDWGDWTHRWNIDALGCPTLTEFIRRGDCHYLAGKLGYCKGVNGTKELDLEATKKAIADAIHEDVGEHGENGDYMALMEALEEFIKEADDRGIEVAYDNVSGDLHDFFQGEMYEYITYRPTAQFIILQDSLLPFFVEQLRLRA